jgi:hypothetical protein
MTLSEILQKSLAKPMAQETVIFAVSSISYVHPEHSNLPNDFKAGFNRSFIIASNGEASYWCWINHAPNKIPQVGDSVRLSYFEGAKGLTAIAL